MDDETMALVDKVNNLFIGLKDAADGLGVTRQALHEAATKGKIEFAKFGNSFFLLRSSLAEYRIDKERQEAGKQTSAAIAKAAKSRKPAKRSVRT